MSGDGFRFAVYRPSLVDDLGTRLGWQDVVLGDPQFDRGFVVKATNEQRVRTVLASEMIRAALLRYPDALLEIIDSPGLLGPGVPPNVDVLQLTIEGSLTDPVALEEVHRLFTSVLDKLWQTGVSVKESPYAWL